MSSSVRISNIYKTVQAKVFTYCRTSAEFLKCAFNGQSAKFVFYPSLKLQIFMSLKFQGKYHVIMSILAHIY